jgi:putative hemolysin
MQGILSRLLGLRRLDRLVERAVALRGGSTIFQSLTRIFDLRLQVSEEDRRRIPADGPVVVVANHPTGAIEGIGVAALLDSVRRDVRTLSHVWFGRYPEIARGMILVDPNAGAREPAGAAVAARESARWVRRGGLLTVYPAGEVAVASGRGEDPARDAGHRPPRLHRRSKPSAVLPAVDAAPPTGRPAPRA